jgi:ABC-type sugar transport system permease subunit
MIFSKAFRLIYHLPGIVGGVIMCIVMKEMYAPDGVVTNLVQKFGIKLPALAQHNGLLGSKETAFPTLMIYHFIFGIGGGGMIMAGAFMKIPEEIFESARIEGCGFFRETFQIALPCVWPTFSTLLIFSLCSIFTADYGAYLYSDGTGKNGLVSVGYYLYRYQVSISIAPDATYLYGYISAFGMLITLATLPIVLISRKLLSKFQDNVEF